MIKKITAVILVAFMGAHTNIHAGPGVVTEFSTLEQFNQAKSSKKFFVLKVYATWCPNSQHMRPIFDQVTGVCFNTTACSNERCARS